MWFNKCDIQMRDELQLIYELPFIKQLGAGVLSQASFDAYLAQDYLYLIDYSRALAYLAGRMTRREHREQMLSLAAGCVQGEMAMQATYLQQSAHRKVKPNNACQTYTDFLLRMTATEVVELGVAAILPCLWVYAEVGKCLVANRCLAGHRFKDWILLYAGDEFVRSTDHTINIFNQMAAITNSKMRHAMLDVFYRGVVLERVFWDDIKLI